MNQSIRAEFPLLADSVYLNSNSTGATPRGVEQVLQNYWQTLSTWRDSAWGGWLAELNGYVEALASFIGAPAGTVVTDTNVSTLLGRIGTCFDFRGERNRVVTTDLEFPTVPFFWRGFARYGAELVVTGTGGPVFDIEAVEDVIDERTRLVCVSHGSYTTGALLDLERVVTRAHQYGALVVVDVFQTIGAVPLDVVALQADFVLGGAHKWMCGAHTAFLYVRQELIESLYPAATGWFAGADPLSFQETGWAPDARRFSGGTPIPITAMMSRVGLDLLAEIGAEKIRAHSLRCTDQLIRRADAAGIEVRTPRTPEHRGGMVNLCFPGDRTAAADLASRGLICSWRNGLRVAPHIYNTIDEIDLFMDALAEVRR
ncbi:aminotransferase class V-fold PLP-dependent enzyme [Kribbella albertanoniae]|uniref:Aminotransferase class V-fold PLP-dependent enzyme n=1 Tax=Kribbella albertanoniae TaxID=1266829 RepID=A0A4R4QGF4_9ACTN|nr:aminotransferase class V-fold PLP-dependent enzyme [Kribbella albertanoniae]TDC34654.1 aminotransferase class V-fold PLP-dependent enzyme [Kribbella albertanoniae]